MSVMNKLIMLSSSSVAQRTELQNTGNMQGSMTRQALAETGNALPAQQPQLSPEERKKALSTAVKQLSGYIQNITRELNFSVDHELDRIVVTVVDDATGDIIRQIPSEELLELAKALVSAKERGSKGLLFSGDA
jgi:flagellar protein FlaG